MTRRNDRYTTEWGAVRAADGHPEPYRVKYIELGNEQYNHLYVDQVAAMEARAEAIGIPRTLHYLFPDNVFLNAADLGRAKEQGLDALADHLVIDLHGPAMGESLAAASFFATAANGTGNSTLAGAMNCEVNAAIHTMRRALTEASDIDDSSTLFWVISRILMTHLRDIDDSSTSFSGYLEDTDRRAPTPLRRRGRK